MFSVSFISGLGFALFHIIFHTVEGVSQKKKKTQRFYLMVKILIIGFPMLSAKSLHQQ
jgi:hypothetical protein